MIKKKRPVFWILLISFVVLAVFWTFYFPYSKENLYRAIPENAIFVSEHPCLSERWVECIKTPLAHGMLNAFGVEDKDIDDIQNDSDIVSAVKIFANRNTVLGYVPRLDLSGRPAWVFASWAGFSTQPLRWGWLSSKMSDFQEIDLGRNRSGWAKPVGADGEELWLSLAAVHGMVLGCVSSDNRGVRYLVDRIEGGVPVGNVFNETFEQWSCGKATVAEQKTLDRIWFKWRGGAPSAKRNYELECALILHGEKGSKGWIKTDFLPQLPEVASSVKVDIAGLNSCMSDQTDVRAIVPLDYVEVFVKRWVPWQGTASLIKAVRDEAKDDGSMCVAMLEPEFGGRIAGMKTCAALVGVRMKEGADGFSVVNRLLDVINRENKASLIPRREKGVEGMISLDSARPGVLKLFGKEHRPAFIERNGWLFLSSSRMALEKLFTEEPSGWSSWGSSSIDGDASAYLMSDLSAVSEAVNGIVSICAIIASVQNVNDEAFTARLQSIRAWMHVLGRLKEGSCSLNVSDGTPEIEFNLGS